MCKLIFKIIDGVISTFLTQNNSYTQSNYYRLICTFVDFVAKYNI